MLNYENRTGVEVTRGMYVKIRRFRDGQLEELFAARFKYTRKLQGAFIKALKQLDLETVTQEEVDAFRKGFFA